MTPAGEFELIDTFVGALPHPRAPFGPGDDAAVLPAPRGTVCVTTDAVVEGVHFSRRFFSLEDVGHKALAVNLSDLAAMGARPTWWVCALGLPKGTGRAEVRALARGMAPLARQHRLALVGGNVTRSPVLTVTLTLAGETARPLLRSGARPGDLLFVSGALGAAAAGLKLLRTGHTRGRLVAAQRRPVPQLALGRLAARWASAAIDLSDGLLADLGHLCAASGVGAALRSTQLPVASTPRLALFGGEDYQLLIAVPPRSARRFVAAASQVTRISQLGELTHERRITLDGKPVRPKGFDHFAR